MNPSRWWDGRGPFDAEYMAAVAQCREVFAAAGPAPASLGPLVMDVGLRRHYRPRSGVTAVAAAYPDGRVSVVVLQGEGGREWHGAGPRGWGHTLAEAGEAAGRRDEVRR